MSRLSRTDAAKSTIAVWRWLHTLPGAPIVEGNTTVLLQALPIEVGHVSRASTTGMDERMKLMETLGLLSRKAHYDPRTNDQGESLWPTRGTTNTLKMSADEGAKLIAKHFANGGYMKVSAIGNKKVLSRDVPEKPVYDVERVAVRTNDKDEPVEAVVGEDAPTLGEALATPELRAQFREMRKDEPAAFVEAARQYENRNEFVIAKLKEIEAMGVVIDREKVLKGVHLQRDDELEGVVKVLPYIAELEQRLKQAEGWREDMLAAQRETRTLRDEKRKAEAEVARQKEANTRLAEKMARETVSRPQVLVGN